MKKITDLLLLIVLFLFLSNIYLFSVDSQIAKAIGVEITPYFLRGHLTPVISLCILYVALPEFLKQNTNLYKAAFLWSPIVLLLLTPPVFSVKQMSDVLLEVAGEVVILFFVIAAFKLPRFDQIFVALSALYLLISLAGCTLDSPYFQMSASHDFGCRGLTAHRNNFGPLVNFLLIYFLAVIRPVFWRTLLAFICLWLSASTFSVGSYLLSTFIISFLLTKQCFVVLNFGRISLLPILIVFSLAGLIIGLAMFDLIAEFTGRFLSFTQRIQIYSVLPHIADYVFWGEGYKSSPSAATTSELVRATNWDDASGMHNSFLSMWRQIGLIPATILLSLFLGLLLKTAARSTFEQPMGIYATLALAGYLLYGLWESGFGPYNSIASVVCMRLIYLNLQTLSRTSPSSEVGEIRRDRRLPVSAIRR